MVILYEQKTPAANNSSRICISSLLKHDTLPSYPSQGLHNQSRASLSFDNESYKKISDRCHWQISFNRPLTLSPYPYHPLLKVNGAKTECVFLSVMTIASRKLPRAIPLTNLFGHTAVSLPLIAIVWRSAYENKRASQRKPQPGGVFPWPVHLSSLPSVCSLTVRLVVTWLITVDRNEINKTWNGQAKVKLGPYDKLYVASLFISATGIVEAYQDLNLVRYRHTDIESSVTYE